MYVFLQQLTIFSVNRVYLIEIFKGMYLNANIDIFLQYTFHKISKYLHINYIHTFRITALSYSLQQYPKVYASIYWTFIIYMLACFIIHRHKWEKDVYFKIILLQTHSKKNKKKNMCQENVIFLCDKHTYTIKHKLK